MKIIPFALCAAMLFSLPACVAGPKVSPVEITRFHSASADLAAGTIFIENAPGESGDPGELATFKSAVAAELAQLGYREVPRGEATQIAQVRVERYIAQRAQKQSPVSVGVGGSTGSYGSGLGMGIGINLGGGQREMVGTNLSIMIRDQKSGAAIWEGRASISVSDNSQFADSQSNAAIIADALFREFPGNNGETVQVRVEN